MCTDTGDLDPLGLEAAPMSLNRGPSVPPLLHSLLDPLSALQNSLSTNWQTYRSHSSGKSDELEDAVV